MACGSWLVACRFPSTAFRLPSFIQNVPLPGVHTECSACVTRLIRNFPAKPCTVREPQICDMPLISQPSHHSKFKSPLHHSTASFFSWKPSTAGNRAPEELLLRGICSQTPYPRFARCDATQQRPRQWLPERQRSAIFIENLEYLLISRQLISSLSDEVPMYQG